MRRWHRNGGTNPPFGWSHGKDEQKTPGFQLQCSSFTVIKALRSPALLCLLQPSSHIKRRCFPGGQVPRHRIQVLMRATGRCERVMIWKSLLAAAPIEQVMTRPPGVPCARGASVVLCFSGSTGSSKGTVLGAGGVPLGQSGLPALRTRALWVPRSRSFPSCRHLASYPERIYSSLSRSPMTLLIREMDEYNTVYCALRMSDKSGHRCLG